MSLTTFDFDWDKTPLSSLLDSSFKILVETGFLLDTRCWESPPGSPNCPAEYTSVGWPALHHHQGETWAPQVGLHTPWMFLCAPLCFLHLYTSVWLFLCTALTVSATSRGHLCRSPHAKGHWNLHIVLRWPLPSCSGASTRTPTPLWVFF